MIERGPHPVVSGLQQTRGDARHRTLDLGHRCASAGGDLIDRSRLVELVAALEVAGCRHPEVSGRHRAVVRPGGLHELVVAPHVEPALLAFGVGVLGGEESPRGVSQVPQQVLQGLHGHPSPARHTRLLPGAQVQAGQLGVVVEHLLEVGDEP